MSNESRGRVFGMSAADQRRDRHEYAEARAGERGRPRHLWAGLPIQEGKARWSAVVAPTAILVLLFSVFVGLAFAGDEEGSQEIPGSPVTADLIREAVTSPEKLGAPPTNPDAAGRLPHKELDREGALELLDAVFGAEVEEPAGLYDSLEVDGFLSDHAAIVTNPEPPDSALVVGAEDPPLESQDAEPTLVESTLPLRTEGADGEKVPVDLGLERSEGELQPMTPLVETEIPGELGDGISLGSLITLELPEAASGRAPSNIEDDAAFYPNVQADTDLLVAPIPTGVETWTQLRSPESPTTQTFHLSLPEGADLEEAETGGVEAKLNGRVLLSVPPATAVDAAGNEVPVAMSAHGHDIELEAAVAPGTQFPVLIDPTWQFENWNWIWGTSTFASWYPYHTDPSYQALTYGYPAVENHALDMTSGFAGSAGVLSRAEWSFYVPRFYSDTEKYGHRPESFIDNAQLEAAMFLLQGNSSYYPVEDAGIIDEVKGEWVSVATHRGTEGEVSGWSGKYWFPNPSSDTHAKVFTFQLVTLENEAQAKYRTALAGEAIVGFGDHNAPEITELIPPSGWFNATEPSKLSYAVADPGLGVYEVQLAKPITWGSETKITKSNYKIGCTGIPANPCPAQVKSSESGRPAVAIEPQYIPEGPQTLTFKATDPLGGEFGTPNSGSTCCGETYPHALEATTTVKIDHSAPTLSLSGTVTEQASLGTAKPQYTVKYSATDGVEEPPALAATSNTSTYVHPADIALDAAENRWTADENNNRIVKTNQAGEVLAAYSAVGTESLSYPTGIDVDSTGNLWVVDSGHNRLVEFNSKGEWMRKIGKFGPGNGEFSSPTGIAVASNGNVWVADTANNRIEEFSSTGSFLGSFGGKGSGNEQFQEPSGVDIGPGNNVWVTDTANNRIEELNEKGEFLAAYGSLGSANGQLNHPTGIDIDTRGSVWVVDQGNGRVEQFSERGEYLAKFGASGTGEGQFTFTGPAGLTTNSAGTLWVADSGNNRISRWNGPRATRSGVRKIAIKVDGKVVQEPSVTCPQGGCPFAGVWTLHSGEYAAGAHTLEVTATDGVGLTKIEKLAITLNPPAPSVTLSGSLTQQASLGATLPRYMVKVEASAEEGTGSAPTVPTFLSAIEPQTEVAKLSHPGGVAIDATGNLWVVDKGKNRVVEFGPTGEFIRAVGSVGAAGGQLSSPSGIAIDSVGNIDVTDTANNRVAQFSPTGAFIEVIGSNVNKTKVEAGATSLEKNRCTAASGNICQAGAVGSGDGQISEPIGITTSGGQNFFVVERGNNRVEKFSPQAEALAKFGELGSGNGQLKEPTGIGLHGFLLWVADTGNHRMEAFTTSYVYSRKFGKEGAGNGEFRSPSAVSADPLGNVWVVDQANSRVQEFSEAGEYLGKFGKAGIGSGQFTLSAPTGIATDAAGNVWVADTNDNRLERWRQGARSRLNSEITIDGKQVDLGEARCLIETCPLTREWTLNSSTLSAGQHTLVAKATDGYGQWTSKSRTIEIQRDTTKPALQVGGELANAPEGWVQQESYGFNASASDEKGYGVTSLVFRIDGATVLSKTQGCIEGSCSASVSGGINMSLYSGGAHSAEVVAFDGAGNSTVKHWTINVDPDGHISTAEATATIEAAEDTGSANLVGESREEGGIAGTAPNLGLEQTASGFAATGSLAPTEVSGTAAGVVNIKVPSPAEIYGCVSNSEPPPEESEADLGGTGTPEGGCSTPTGNESGALMPVSVELLETSNLAGLPVLVEENAIVVANSTSQVDTTTRPLSDGGLIFESIRDPSGPEQFKYHVTLGEGQELVQIDEQTVEVLLAGGFPSFTITAKPASDAIGTTVPTTLQKSGSNTVTLTVHHRAGSGGQPFVYPVVGGSGWEGGFRTIEVDMDNISPEEEAEEGWEELTENVVVVPGHTALPGGRYLRARVSAQGPPVARPGTNGHKFSHRYKFSECRWESGVADPPEYEPVPEAKRVEVAGNCLKERSPSDILFGVSIHGWYWYEPEDEIWVNNSEEECDKWGPYKPAMVNCEPRPVSGRDPHHVAIYGNFRLRPGTKANIARASECITIWGVLTIKAPHKHERESITSQANPAGEEWEPCDWPQQ